MKLKQDQELPDLFQIAFDHERRVVGACLTLPALMSQCNLLAPTHFTNSDCRAVWSVMATLHKQGGSWDVASVASELAQHGMAEPEATLARLTEGVVATTAIGRAAAKVRQMWLRLRILKEAESFQRSLLDPADDLIPTLRSTRQAIEGFVAEHEESQIGMVLAGPKSGASPTDSHILDEITNFIGRFLVLTNPELLVIALWIVHTWAIEASDTMPYLAITSAEKRSGKTRLLEILQLLVRRPWLTGRITPAVLARKIESESPTLVLDEWDATARGNQESAETLRGILNSGNRRNGKISVCVLKGKEYQPADFSVFGPKAIAGIGSLPETIADRAIPIRLKRKAPDEVVERLRHNLVLGEAGDIKARLMTWVNTHLEQLRGARPPLPESLTDRQQDGAEPLLAIADAVGGDWPARARDALVELHSRGEDKDESLGVTLLSDIREIFYETGAEKLASQKVVEALAKVEGRPWATWDHSRAITPNALARLLAPFDIFSRNLRIGSSFVKGGQVVKGYQRECFSDSWNRYLPPLAALVTSPTDATSLQAATELNQAQLGKKTAEPDVAASDTNLRPHLHGIVAM